jgi:hypothetical protein
MQLGIVIVLKETHKSYVIGNLGTINVTNRDKTISLQNMALFSAPWVTPSLR